MLKPSDLKRILGTVKYLIRENGVRGAFSAIRDRIRLERQLLPFRKVKAVTLDGCTFDVTRLPNFSIKVALLNKTYEDFERRTVLQYARPELPVVELGACIGVVACITNKLLRNPKKHVVVEANPNVLSHLNDNRAANGCQFEVLNAAISYGQKSVTFTPSADFWGSSLEQKNGREQVTVETIRLGDIISSRNFESFTLICDIEGHEYGLMSHEADVLAKADTIILETHARMIGEPKTLEMLNSLKQLGFRTVNQDSCVYVLKRSVEMNRCVQN